MENLYSNRTGENAQLLADDAGFVSLLVPRETPGVRVKSYEWTLNMPTDHATVEFNRAWVPGSAVLGSIDQGLAVAQTFVHENRIRQAASSCGSKVLFR